MHALPAAVFVSACALLGSVAPRAALEPARSRIALVASRTASPPPRRSPIAERTRGRSELLQQARRAAARGDLPASLRSVESAFAPRVAERTAPVSAAADEKAVVECNQLIRVLGDRGHLREARDVFGLMVGAGLSPTQVTYGTLVARAGAWRQPKLAVTFYRDMLRRGISPDTQTYNSLINAFAKASDVGKAYSIAGAMRRRGVRPSLVTFNTLLDACARAGNSSLAHGTLGELEAAGLTPNERTYSIMIALCARSHVHGVDDAFEWLRRMRAAGMSPNAVTYSTLINACGRSGQIERAFALVAQMESVGLVPNVVTYTSLIDACAKAPGRLPRALALFRQMRERGVAPNAVTCHALFSGCVQQGDVPAAREVLQHMASLKLRPSVHAYTALLARAADARSSAGGAQRAAATDCLLKQMSQAYPDVSRQPSTFRESLGSRTSPPLDGPTAATATPDSAAAAANVTPARPVRPAVSAPSSELEGASGGARQDAEETSTWAPQPFLADATRPPSDALRNVFAVFGAMRRATGLSPDLAAFNQLINSCAKEGDVARAEGAFGEMVAAGIAPDTISYNSLIKAAAVSGDVAAAEKFFGEMEQPTNHFSSYTPPSERTFANLMSVQFRAGNASRVLELLAEMRSRRIAPAASDYSLAIQACAWDPKRPRTLRRALSLYAELRRDGLRLDTPGLLSLQRILAAHELSDLAARIRQERSQPVVRRRPPQAQQQRRGGG